MRVSVPGHRRGIRYTFALTRDDAKFHDLPGAAEAHRYRFKAQCEIVYASAADDISSC